MLTESAVEDLVDRWIVRAAGVQRLIVGLAGAPGAGKSTFAAAICRALVTRGISSVCVGLDGFHLADATLDALGSLARKGAPDTFDPRGYLAFLERLRNDRDITVYAPDFNREIEQPIAGAISISPDVRIVVTEGNYLLLDEEPWDAIATVLDEVWFVRLDHTVRQRRLLLRHQQFGKSAGQARAWVLEVDEPNALLVEASAHRATGILLGNTA